MFLDSFFNLSKNCRHTKVPIDVEIGYCPDCGELVENKWYITRCACCGVKQKTTIRNGEIVPEASFCNNCGSRRYIVEQLENIDCVNINYAILKQEIIQNEINEYTQSWQDAMQTSNCTPKLLRQYR